VAALRGTAAKHNLIVEPQPAVSGVTQGEMDLPVAMVTPVANGQELGTWMTSLYFSLMPQDEPQVVEYAGKPYELALRYKRVYKPYSVQLVDFKHDVYIGTSMPKNYSSQIRLIDPAHNENREVLIYMNNPLRYRGETFYQASFKQGDMGTVLQVVRNPGWLMPYIACTLGALGMLIHFGQQLLKSFSRRKAT
jgi:cytochrome c biogenesis protein ResB